MKRLECHCGKPSIFSILAWLVGILLFFVKKPFQRKGREKINRPDVKKIAYVSVYGTECGISTYNEALVPHISNNLKKENIESRIFAEKHPHVRYSYLEIDPAVGIIERCWHRSESNHNTLVNSIVDWGADIVHISHEYGLFPNGFKFAKLVKDLQSHNIKVIVTFHSVYTHLDKLVTEIYPDILVVHTEEAKKCLVDKGIFPEKIKVIPHGSTIFKGTSDSPKVLPKLWNHWGCPVIFHPGFLFEYKGHIKFLDTLKEIVKKYPDVKYVIQASENPQTKEEHDRVCKKLEYRIKQLKLSDNVLLSRGFITNEALINMIRESTIVVLPYIVNPDHDVRATSGIGRLVVSTEVPLVTSDAHLFDDIKEVSFQASSKEDMIETLDLILSGNLTVNTKDREDFLKSTAWEVVAKNIIDLYKER